MSLTQKKALWPHVVYPTRVYEYCSYSFAHTDKCHKDARGAQPNIGRVSNQPPFARLKMPDGVGFRLRSATHLAARVLSARTLKYTARVAPNGAGIKLFNLFYYKLEYCGSFVVNVARNRRPIENRVSSMSTFGFVQVAVSFVCGYHSAMSYWKCSEWNVSYVLEPRVGKLPWSSSMKVRLAFFLNT